MTYLNKAIYFIGRVWFAFVMFLALVLTTVLSIPFFLMDWIDGSSSKTNIIIFKNKEIQMPRSGS